jgi:putative membrane protein
VLPIIIAAMAAVILFADASLLRSMLLLLIPAIFIPFLWLDWHKYRYGIDERQIYVRRGWWQERLTIAPQIKVQTVEIAQGPVARRQGLASLHFGIAGGTLEMVALPIETAHQIREAVMKKVAAVDYSAINRPH